MPFSASEEATARIRSAGVVYVLLNPHMQGLVKIGKTNRNADLRASELSQRTGVPGEFIVIFELEVTDCDRVERLIHERLDAHRLPNKEFFRMAPTEAIQALMEVSKNFLLK